MSKYMLFIYNIFFPLAFLFFVPGMIYKLIRRPGYKRTFLERFAIFSEEQRKLLASCYGGIWIHSVSVGETMIALSFIKKWQAREPEKKFVLSTTTTTGQELARAKISENVPVFFCPLDFIPFVKKVVNLINPSMLVIFETEIWPNMISEVRKNNGKVVLVNARMSDKSYGGYYRFRSFFRPVLEKFNLICVQSDIDGERFSSIAPDQQIKVCGNMKFDQEIPENLPEIELKTYFGEGEFLYILGASTHPGEEQLIAEKYLKLKNENNALRLILIPRHAERGNEIVAALKNLNLSFHRKTATEKPEKPVDCLLADTTGEMLGFINRSDIVIMGKSLAGHREGHNLVEPALLEKPIVTGSILKNFRVLLNILTTAEAIITIDNDNELENALKKLINDQVFRQKIGKKAKQAIDCHRGATLKIIELLEKLVISH